jgi:tetratricopeptide (TPR) repeat protein
MLQDMRYIEVCYFYLTQLRGKVLETVCRNIAENSSMLSKVMANMSYVSRQQNPIPKWSISIKPEDYDTGTELLSWCNKRAAFLNSQNRQQEAIGLYETILATNRKCVDAWNGKGNALISADTNAADSCFAQALKYNPKSTEALHGRGAVIVKLQQFSKSKLEKALGYFDEVLELNPESLNTLYLKAIVILHLGQLDESIKYLDKILDVSPDNGPAWDIKGDTLCKLKRFDEALKCYDEVDRIFPDSRWTKKANILYNLERFKEALRCYTAATRINPYSSDDWYNKALTEDKLDFTEQAILSFEHWLSFNLQSPAAVQKKKYAHNRINELNRKRRSVVD